ncbi:MAG: ACT domain-containing protein, partial [Candidatus Brocadiia bacterium]
VSQQLLQQVRDSLDAAGARFRCDEDAGRALLDLLAGSVGVAQRIGWMRDCGLLQACLPELAPLMGGISPEEAGEFTLDEHAVEALRVIDSLGHATEPGTLPQRHALEQVQRMDLLRLAILLHHVDTSGDGNPARAAAGVAERLGLSSRERTELTFLTENQSLLWQSLEREGVREETAGKLADSIAEPERLRMLYLAGYAHGRAQGAPGQFAWRGPKLFELYQKTMALLSPGYVPFATGEHFERELLALAARDGVEDQARKLREMVPDLYKSEVSPAEALSHLEMIARLDSRPAAMRWRIGERDARVWVCTSDVPARFAQIAGVFTHAGLDILSATAFTLGDGTVLDRFVVRMKGRPINPDPTFWQGVEEDLVSSIRGDFDVAEALRARTAEEQRERAMTPHRQITSVRLENPPGLPVTALDVVARDRPGLLFDLSDAMGREGLNIEYALIRTQGELAQDVFHVTDSGTGKRIADKARLRRLREQIEEVAG